MAGRLLIVCDCLQQFFPFVLGPWLFGHLHVLYMVRKPRSRLAYVESPRYDFSYQARLAFSK